MLEEVVSRHMSIKTTLFVFNLAFNTHRVYTTSVCGAIRFFSFVYIPSYRLARTRSPQKEGGASLRQQQHTAEGGQGRVRGISVQPVLCRASPASFVKMT